jgi:cyclophilin family peptidyl-prolyl cis-trans isomerase/HEAT repeat protein
MRPATVLLVAGLVLSAAPSGAGRVPSPPEPRIAAPTVDSFASILRLEDRRELGGDLFKFLASADPVIRARAAVAAGRIGDTRAIDPLAALLRDRDGSVRAAAAFALGEIEDSAAAVPISWLLRGGTEPGPHVRALAIEALAKCRAARFAPLCVAALSDTSAEVRAAAALASWQIQAAAAWTDLVRLAGEPAMEPRWTSTYALMRMLGAAAPGRTPIPGGSPLPPESRPPICAILIERSRDPDVRCRLAAVRGLGSFGDGETNAALRGSVADPDWRVRVEAVRSLATTPPHEMGSADSLRPIDPSDWRVLLRDPNPNVRIAAIEATGTLVGLAGATTMLRDLLERTDLGDREREVASLAIAARWTSALEKAPPARAESLKTAISGLARTLAESKSWSLRAAAPEVLAGAAPTDRTLLERLLHDDPRVAKTAIEPLFKLEAGGHPAGQGVLDALRSDLDWLLDSPDPVLRAIAIESAGSLLGDSTDAPTRAEWLSLLRRQWDRARSDRENDVALAILGRLEGLAGETAAQGILRDAAGSSDRQVRQEALRILVEKGFEKTIGPLPPIETNRAIEEYASILKWARGDHRVEIRTSSGVVRIRLFAADAPLTCWNFTRLAESGFFDGGRWHRIVPDFVVQDGCPRGDGYGGPGATIRCEINEERFTAGAVGMALSGKDTGGSQFFICHSPQPHLDGRYTVFGQVVEGMDVVDRLTQHDPIESIRSLP